MLIQTNGIVSGFLNRWLDTPIVSVVERRIERFCNEAPARNSASLERLKNVPPIHSQRPLLRIRLEGLDYMISFLQRAHQIPAFPWRDSIKQWVIDVIGKRNLLPERLGLVPQILQDLPRLGLN